MQAEDLVRARIREVLAVPGVDGLVAAYFSSDGPFAGMSFDLVGENPPDVLLWTTCSQPVAEYLLAPARYPGTPR
ncbi:hypothetical protein ACTWLT_15130 [Micromonospora sp. ZYX-F-536]|uniref:hypothetical protein n=1 Tax=Micromonospora sp. ZYX-F-536 TaxID=3457629 RepID=UPI004040C660